MTRPSAPTMGDAVRLFLGAGFDEPEKPYRTQREMRDDAMRVLGFNQAQEQLRGILRQSKGRSPEIAETYHENAIKPSAIGGRTNLWFAPEYPVRKR